MMTQADVHQEYSIRKWQLADKPERYRNFSAANAVRDVNRKVNIYRRYVGLLEPVTLPSGAVVEYEEYLASPEPQPEAVIIAGQLEARLRARLTPRQNKILTFVVEGGYQQNEIGALVGLHPAGVCREIKIIQAITREIL